MRFLRSIIVTSSVFAGLVLGSLSGAHAASPLTYEIELNGKPVGQIVHEYVQQPDGGHGLKLSTQIETKSFFSKVRINSVLEETISADGYLDAASNRLVENKKTYWTKIQRSGSSYLAFTAEMKTPEQLETEELAGLAKEVIATVVPYAGDAMTVAGILLSDKRDAPQHKRLTTDHFDTSLIGLPLYWQSNGYDLPSSLTIIDTEEMSVFKAKVKDLGDTQISVGGKNLTVRHIQLDVANAKPMEIWMVRPETGPAHFFQISGMSDGAKFKVTMAGAH